MAQLSIYHPPGEFGLKTNPFGADVANLALFRALARHGGLEALNVLGLRPPPLEEAVEGLLGGAASDLKITVGTVLDHRAISQSGALLRGQPTLVDLAWFRRRAVGDRAYSLAGLAHTLAPPFMREAMALAAVAPTQPWDAIICTSPSVRDGLTEMFAEWGDYLGERMAGGPPPMLQLPIIPLGVDADALAQAADRPAARASLRAELGLADADVLVLWVGRLSYFEKAFPQAMFKAVQAAAQDAGVKAAFALAGWFPAERDRGFYEAAAKAYAPDVDVRFMDGNDAGRLADLWAASDVFISLVDNIQETFGIAPVEAMAAGLPVVISDWDGYRSTVRDGVEGFLVPTLIGPGGGLGHSIQARHTLGVDSYQAYVGAIAQHTAVHVGRAAARLSELFASPALRKQMGAAGRARVRDALDWPVVARQYTALLAELAAIRAAHSDVVTRHPGNPARGEPFGDFARFATQPLTPDTRLRAAPGATAADLRPLGSVDLDVAFPAWRGNLGECARALDLLATGKAATVREVLVEFPVPRRRHVELGLVWMAKLGFVDWLT